MQKFFEYHCLESEKSKDKELWHHTKQIIKVLGVIENGIGKTKKERLYNGCPRVYKIKFKDGFIGEAFEDELYLIKK